MYGTPQGIAAPMSSISPTSSGQYTTQRVAAPVATVAPAAAARKPKPKPKPKTKAKPKAGGVPNVNQYLAGDTTYQDQQSQLMKQLEQFKTSNASQQGMVNQDYQTALNKMGLQKTQDLNNMTEDYGSRGLMNSGLLTKSVGEYDTNYQNQLNDLATGQQRSLGGLLEDLQSYISENSAGSVAAKQDAIRRRAQKYGITTS